MSYPLFSTDYVDMLKETLLKLEYPEIVRICSTNRQIYTYCKNNYSTLIAPKRQQYIRQLTNQLIQQERNSYDALVTASRNGNIHIVRELLNRNLNLNFVGPIAVRAAEENNQKAVVQLLLNNSTVFNALTKGQKMYYALRET